MKPQLGRNDSHLAYLEPPHSHDPASVSNIAALPPLALNSLPPTVQTALYNLQQSTSIVYASFLRLQELLEERFDRLLPSVDIDGEITFSESSFFNYVNSLRAERTYLISDAHPDWRHKASLARVAVQPYYDLLIETESAYPEAPSNVFEWWEDLQSAVASWCEYAKAVRVPDYEETVSEYLALHKHVPALASDIDETPLETPLGTPTPTLEQEPTPLEICELEEKNFEVSVLLQEMALGKATKPELTTRLNTVRVINVAASELQLNNESKARDERKDSGIGMKD